jgi:hypothetical protein
MNGNKSSNSQAAFSCSVTVLALGVFYFATPMVPAALIVIPPPPSVQPGAIQSQTDAIIFQESVSI